MFPTNAEPLSPDERRSHPRKPCPIDCSVASYKPGTCLENLAFEAVTLNDLGAGGFSFWTSLWPQHAEVVLSLTTLRGGALLAHIRQVQCTGSRYLVRCQFLRRLSDPA